MFQYNELACGCLVVVGGTSHFLVKYCDDHLAKDSLQGENLGNRMEVFVIIAYLVVMVVGVAVVAFLTH